MSTVSVLMVLVCILAATVSVLFGSFLVSTHRASGWAFCAGAVGLMKLGVRIMLD